MQAQNGAPSHFATPLPTMRGPIRLSFVMYPIKSHKCGCTQEAIEAFARNALDGHYKTLIRRLGGDPSIAYPL